MEHNSEFNGRIASLAFPLDSLTANKISDLSSSLDKKTQDIVNRIELGTGAKSQAQKALIRAANNLFKANHI